MEADWIHTRREFMRRGLAMLSASATVPLFLDRTAWAIGDPFDSPLVKNRPGANDDRILVVLQLAGGNDGLNTIIPFRDDLYYRARPRLAVPTKDVLRLTDDIGLHNSATGLKKLYDDGLLAIIQGVGYPNPDRSHFVSTDIWSTGDPQGRQHEGWIGRYFDCTCSGRDRPDPKRAIALTQEAPLALQGRRFAPVSFSSPDELMWRANGATDATQDAFERLNQPEGSADAHGDDPFMQQRRPDPAAAKRPTPRAAKQKPATKKSDGDAFVDQDAALAYLRRVAMDARASADEIRGAAGSGVRAGRGRGARRAIPGKNAGNAGPLGEQLAMVRRMIAAGLDTKVYYVSFGGFDTHVNQANRHAQLLAQLSEALASFTADLKRDGLLDRVLLMTFSEFGRRVEENASGGTDHGAAAPLFIVGGAIKPGLHGRHPSLAPSRLDQGDLAWHVDFRSIYAGVLADWLKADAKQVLGGAFTPARIVRT